MTLLSFCYNLGSGTGYYTAKTNGSQNNTACQCTDSIFHDLYETLQNAEFFVPIIVILKGSNNHA